MVQRKLTRASNYAIALVLTAGLCADAGAARDDENVQTRLAKLERTLDSRGLIDLLQQVDNLQTEVQRLRGQVEEQNYTIDQLRKSQRDTYVDMDRRLLTMERGGSVALADPALGSPMAPPLTQLEAGTPDTIAGTEAPRSLQVEETLVGIDATVPGAAGATAPSAPAAPAAEIQARPSIVARGGPTVDNEASETAYRDAFGLLKAGKYDDSITAFNEFLALHPNSQYADNAQYWLGETYYVKREFDAALNEYRKLIETYPESKKQSHAMLKIGYSYHELGQLDQARAVLEDLRTRFSGTTAARLADERIQILAAASP